MQFYQNYLIRNFDILCNKFIELFDSIEQARRAELQQQIEKIRIVK